MGSAEGPIRQKGFNAKRRRRSSGVSGGVQYSQGTVGRGDLMRKCGNKPTKYKSSAAETCIRTIISSCWMYFSRWYCVEMSNAHLEEHKVLTLLGNVVSEGGAFSNTAFCSKSGPSGEFECIHGDCNERGGVEARLGQETRHGVANRRLEVVL